MKSKTSFFNRTIFIKNILRFWPMWVLYLIILFFMLPVSLYRNTNPDFFAQKELAESQLKSVANVVNNSINANFILVVVMAIIFALLIFGYLYNAKSCNMIHALPVSRKELFTTGYLNGLLFLIGPQILMFLISLIVCIINHVTNVEPILYWLVFSVIASFLFLSAAVFCCMLSGNVIAALVYYVAGNFIYVAIRFLVWAVISTVNYGMEYLLYNPAGGRDNVFSPVVYLVSRVGVRTVSDADGTAVAVAVKGMPAMLFYLIPAVLLLIFAAIFYQKRQLECAGDIVAFRWMNPVFRWVIAFTGGVGLGLVFAGVFFSSDRKYAAILILFSAGMTLVFFFLAEMILKKRFRIFRKKIWLEGIISAAAVLLLVCAVDADLFRVERRIPDVSQVQAALLEAPAYDVVATAPEKIEMLEDAHQSTLDHKKEYEDVYYDNQSYYAENGTWMEMTTYSITYYLKDGRSLKRRYTIPAGEEYREDPSSAISLMNRLQRDPEEFLKYSICKNYENVTYTGASMDVVSYDPSDGAVYSDTRNMDQSQAQVLYEALVQDITEGNYPFVQSDEGLPEDNAAYYNTLFFSGQVLGNIESIYEDIPDNADTSDYMESSSVLTDESANSSYSTVYPSFNIYPSCTHTIQALIDLGIIRDQSDLTNWEEYDEWESDYGITYEQTDSLG